ncbi:MAG: 16S rRNA (uracil(1498)-N(3))-methyltransferase, partial [Deltaproteobacteria bacterium]|nr:16S rRNA (uracil(1498)-N(3))-methyltransferase [Deltaproteobacteria bacterium]
MPQFPIPAGKKVGNLVRLSPDESKHLSSVLRGQKGDRLTLFDGTHRFSGEIVSADPKKVVVRLVNQLDTPHLKGDVTLCQAMLKKDRMEWVVQKAVELGAARLIPFSSERTIPKEIGESKIGRWQKIADEAMKQCG